MIDMAESKRRGYLTAVEYCEPCTCPRCGHEEDDAYRVAREMWRRAPIVIYGERDGRRLWYVDGREMDRIPLEWECGACGLRWYIEDSPNGFRKLLLDLEEDADGRSAAPVQVQPPAPTRDLAE